MVYYRHIKEVHSDGPVRYQLEYPSIPKPQNRFPISDKQVPYSSSFANSQTYTKTNGILVKEWNEKKMFHGRYGRERKTDHE